MTAETQPHQCDAACIVAALGEVAEHLEAGDALARRLGPIAVDLHRMAASLAVLAAAAARWEAP